MAAAIKFYANNVTNSGTDTHSLEINHSAGSGLGFYGAGYGISVPISEYQDSTFTTNANGTATDYTQLHNTKPVGSSPTSGVKADTVEGLYLNQLPNFQAPLNIRFTNDTAVRVQNCKLKIFDRNDITKPPKGVYTYVYEVRHPSTLQSVGDLDHKQVAGQSWKEFSPSGIVSSAEELDFTSSPGVSGTNSNANDPDPNVDGTLGHLTRNGASHTGIRHDWYVAIGASPDSIGSKTDYGLYFTLEYL
tara:strand:- start:1382 stop:2122 length:741 start_codon:yes stop_codon:yes gene_type:complete